MDFFKLQRLRHYLQLTYPVSVVATEDGFRGHFPDLPGCGSTHEEPQGLYRKLDAARHDWILQRVLAGLPIPVPNSYPHGAPSPLNAEEPTTAGP